MVLAQLTSVAGSASIEEVSSVVERDGTVVIRDLVPTDQLDQMLEDMNPYFEQTPKGRDRFSGFETTRTGNLFGRSAVSAGLVLHPLIADVAERVLTPHEGIQIGETMAIRVGPDAPRQKLHRDDGYRSHPGPECLMSVMFAGTDFTEENGATWIIPGSNHWGEERKPSPEEAVQACVSKGSVVMWVGSVYHGAGENRTDQWRAGFLFDFRLGWLRQAENQYLTVPRETVKDFPERLQRLLGYSLYGRFTGYIANWQEDPITYLRD